MGNKTFLTSLCNATSARSGFTLPVVLIISISLLIIGLSMTKNAFSVSDSLRDQNYRRLANEAAEAGISYANFCLNRNNHAQTWGPSVSKPNLAPNTDCNGTTNANTPAYVVDNSQLHTAFSVGDLEVRDDGAIIIAVTGSLKQTVGTSAQVARTYSATRKQVVKWQSTVASKAFNGYRRGCGIISGSAWCWGTNEYGQLGVGASKVDPTKIYNLPLKVTQANGVLAGKTIQSMALAFEATCALTTDGNVYCWGRNNSGQVGVNTATATYPDPVKVDGALLNKTVTAIGAYANTICAIAGGKIYCWGNNGVGQVGDGTTTNRLTPTAVATGASTDQLQSSYSAIALADDGAFTASACAIMSNNVAYCWGSNTAGQIGDGSNTSPAPTTNALGSKVLVPVRVQGLLSGKTVTQISIDGDDYVSGNMYAHTCALASGQVYCWGANTEGQLGNNTQTQSNTPVAVRANSGDALFGKTITRVATGVRHSCALTSEPAAYCWGGQNSGQLGNGVTSSSQKKLLPVPVSVLAGGLQGKLITFLSGGANRACVIASGINYCWGTNSSGQLGDGTTTDRNVPTQSIFLRPKGSTYVF